MRLTSGPGTAQGSLIRQVHGEEPHEQAVRVLSVDGGGVRGIVPAMVLAEIERRTGKKSADLFDVVAGTSIGSVLAVGVTVPGDDGRPRWSAEEGVDIFKERLPKVFDRSGWHSMAGVGGLFQERYDQGPVEAMLDHYFGDHMLSEALADVVVPAYDLVGNDVLLFDSVAAKSDPDQDLLMRVVIRGSTAAPTYFEPEPVGPPLTKQEYLLVDGGLFANNPGVCAFMEVQRRHLGSDVVMISLGTGASERPLTRPEVKSWGLAHWARPIFNLVMDSASQATHHHLRSLLGGQRYFRFNPGLKDCSHRLDDAGLDNLKALEERGRELIASSSEQIDQVCELIDR